MNQHLIHEGESYKLAIRSSGIAGLAGRHDKYPLDMTGEIACGLIFV